MITCPLCGFTFNEEEARSFCSSCALGKHAAACRFIRCPNCYYEIPPEPKLVKRIKLWRKRRGERSNV